VVEPLREVCRSGRDVARLSGRVVAVHGTYRQVDVRRKQTPPPRLEGHAAVALDDGTLVFLEPAWSARAIRPEDERRSLDGRRVVATGLLHARAPSPPEPVAALIDPCLSPVHRVEPAEG
jgi:hypothetical protein